MDKLIYLDNAATTRMLPEAVEGMIPYFSEYYGNASSIYRLGQESRKAVSAAREIIGRSIHADPSEIYFTGAVPSPTIGRFWRRRGVMEPGGSISLRRPLSITQCSIPAAVWKKWGMR